MVQGTPAKPDIKAVVFDTDAVLCRYSLRTRLDPVKPVYIYKVEQIHGR